MASRDWRAHQASEEVCLGQGRPRLSGLSVSTAMVIMVIPSTSVGALLVVLVAEKGLCPVQASLKNAQTLRQLVSTRSTRSTPNALACRSICASCSSSHWDSLEKFETQNTRHSESARGAEKLTASVLRFYTSKAQKVNAALHYRAVFNYSGNYPPFLQST